MFAKAIQLTDHCSIAVQKKVLFIQRRMTGRFAVQGSVTERRKSRMDKKTDGMLQIPQGIEFARKLSLAYSVLCKPLCQELKLPQTAFDILLFLANNPDYQTASDIVEIRKIKANLVSVNVEKLVKEGYLRRDTVKGDRRKTLLCCTKKAELVIEKGRDLQKTFAGLLLADVDSERQRIFAEIMQDMEKIIGHILQDE